MNEEDIWLLPEIKERKVKLEEGKKNKNKGIRIVVISRGEWEVQIETD